VETSLGLNTVRIIIDQRDRTSVKHRKRIRRNMGEERTWQSRERVRDRLPRRASALQQEKRRVAQGS
jgi:transcription initiation factor TFIIIB Brf1 subunit/transcription initiation factor TFIIB